MKTLISYFSKRPLISNVIFFGTLLLGVFTWFSIGKEELPEFASNWIRVRTIYPGASAEDVELFVTKVIEDELKGVDGIEEVSTTSSSGSSNIRIVIDDDFPDKKDVVQEIKDAVLRVNLPSEVRDLPQIRQFKSTSKAILDIGIYHKNHRFLDSNSRREVQKYILSFESQLLSLPEVSSLEKNHYRKPELKIIVNPDKMKEQDLTLSEVKKEIQKNHIRAPIGSLKDRLESKISISNELETKKSLDNLILRGNFDGKNVRLSDIASISNDFSDSTSIFKINGHEGVFLNVRKNISTDILTAQKAVMNFIKKFKEENVNVPIEIVLMDDESYAVTNRLDIVFSNGILGFCLIIIVLFIFLSAKAGFWVAMGIPFSMAFTLIIANFFGYTVNNMTLAGIIIVLGIVVDDAIIISENIVRYIEKGLDPFKASVIGTSEMFRPILASISTTCVAFIPLMFFEGFFGKFVSYIPLIVILMLLGSLIESLFILPSHICEKSIFFDRFEKKKDHWFYKYEKVYQNHLIKLLNIKYLIISLGVAVLFAGSFVFVKKMKFVMFPREESKEIFIKVKTPKKFTRMETATALTELEEIFSKDKDNVVAVRSTIAKSRRGGGVKNNEASVLVELLPADDRSTSLNNLMKKWNKSVKMIKNLEEVKILRGRWGHTSGNAIELMISENNDKKRENIIKAVEEYMIKERSISDVEVDRPLVKNEYIFRLKQKNLVRFDIDPAAVISTLRSFVEGSIVYSINKGDEEVDVRLTVSDEMKIDLDEILNLRVSNKSGKLAHLNKVVEIQKAQKPINIKRTNFKRMTMIYANPSSSTKLTPVQIAEKMEKELFPKLAATYPTSTFSFHGEIKDTREGQGEFANSIILVIAIIFMILVMMFNSLVTPLIVIGTIPFGLAGIVFTLYLHDMSVFGFFAAVGVLGMMGVVVNDAIVMIDKFEKVKKEKVQFSSHDLALIASGRLRPVLVTTFTTVVGILPTAYGIAGHDSMLAEMMLTMGWGILFGTFITLGLVPIFYSFKLKN